MQFQITAVRLDGSQIVASIVSEGYDMVMRYEREEFMVFMDIGSMNWSRYWSNMGVNDSETKTDLYEYIAQSSYLLSCLRDTIRMKEIEAVIYEPFVLIEREGENLIRSTDNIDHLHSLITQYGDGRVETELLKVK